MEIEGSFAEPWIEAECVLKDEQSFGKPNKLLP